MRDRDAPRNVYVAGPRYGNRPVKVGCTRQLALRMRDLQRFSSEEMKLHAFCLGDCKLERAVHCFLSESHCRGEWFYPSEKLNLVIEWMQNGKLSESLPRDLPQHPDIPQRKEWASRDKRRTEQRSAA